MNFLVISYLQNLILNSRTLAKKGLTIEPVTLVYRSVASRGCYPQYEAVYV